MIYIICGSSILAVGGAMAEKKLLENGSIEQARWIHYAAKAVLIGTFVGYLVGLTIRCIHYFL